MNIRTAIETAQRNPATTIILGILLVSVCLRLWGIWFGLPFLFHNDEGNEVLRALRLGSGSFDFERISKGGYFYVLFIEYGFLFVILKIVGVVESANDFGVYFIREPAAFYLIGRATTAVIGTFAVYIVYRIGKLAYSPVAALCAATLLAVNILHAQLSHYITVDVPMACLATGALYFSVKIIDRGHAKDYLWAAVLAALAASTKISAVLLLLPLVLAHFFHIHNDSGGWRKYFLKPSLLQAAAIYVVTYVILSPGILVNFGPLMSHVFSIFGADSGISNLPDNVPDSESLAARTNLFTFYLVKIIDSMTLPVFILCAIGSLYALRTRRQVDIVLLTFGLSIYVVMSLSSDKQLFFPRYILPLIPIMTLFGGRLLDTILSKVPMTWRRHTSILVLLVLSASPAYQIALNNYISVQKDTRVFAKEWFDTHVQDGDKVLIEGSPGTLYEGTVPLRYSPAILKSVIRYHSDSDPAKAKYFRMALKAVNGKTFDLVGVRADELQTLEKYKDMGIQYFVLRPENYVNSRLRTHWAELVQELREDSNTVLVQRFDPVQNITPGPTIEIYRNLAATTEMCQ